MYACGLSVCSGVIERHGVSQCALHVTSGLYFGGSSGYAALQDSRHTATPSFRVYTDFTTTVIFRSATLDAVLIAAWHSQNCFAALGLVNGQVSRPIQLLFYSRHFFMLVFISVGVVCFPPFFSYCSLYLQCL